MKKYLAIFVSIMVLFSLSFCLTSCEKTKQLALSADAVLADYNANTTSYELNGTFVEEGKIKVYYVTMRTSAQAYASIDEGVSKSEYPDMTKKLLLQALANSMKEAAVKVYDSLTEVFAGTGINCAFAILDENGTPIATYDDQGWDQ